MVSIWEGLSHNFTWCLFCEGEGSMKRDTLQLQTQPGTEIKEASYFHLH